MSNAEKKNNFLEVDGGGYFGITVVSIKSLQSFLFSQNYRNIPLRDTVGILKARKFFVTFCAPAVVLLGR